MHYIKDVFEGKETEHAHAKFVRYSKGDFFGPQLRIIITKKNIRINASFHLIDELLYAVTNSIGNKVVEIKGTLSWNKDLKGELEELGIKYLKVSKARGIFKYTLQNEVKFKDFVEKLSCYHLLVNFKYEDIKFSVKNKLPKPNKEVKNDFCKVTFPKSMEKKLLKEFAFGLNEVPKKELLISNMIKVNEIIMPEVDNFDEARRLAKRKGVMKRIFNLDKGEDIVSEVEFNV